MQKFRSLSGFTLVEMSIVLVIIGLLAGGVMIGKHLIHVAEVHAQIRQMQDYDSAYNTFKLKYNCIPGDCVHATDFFPGVENGDGNGLIQNIYKVCYDREDYDDDFVTENFVEYFAEYHYFFKELKLAGFLRDNTVWVTGDTGLPAVSLDKTSAFFPAETATFECNPNSRNPPIDNYKTGVNALWFVACNMHEDHYIQYWDDDCGIFTGVDLKAIDLKVDDGRPLSGKLLGFGGYDSPRNPQNDTECLNSSYTDYDTSKINKQCQAVVMMY